MTEQARKIHSYASCFYHYLKDRVIMYITLHKRRGACTYPCLLLYTMNVAHWGTCVSLNNAMSREQSNLSIFIQFFLDSMGRNVNDTKEIQSSPTARRAITNIKKGAEASVPSGI